MVKKYDQGNMTSAIVLNSPIISFAVVNKKAIKILDKLYRSANRKFEKRVLKTLPLVLKVWKKLSEKYCMGQPLTSLNFVLNNSKCPKTGNTC